MALKHWSLLLIVGCCTAAGAADLGLDLIDAVKRQDSAAVKRLLTQKASLTTVEADGSTALHWAAQRNDTQMVDVLLAAGSPVQPATRYNITPIYFACLNGNLAMVERLLQAGADPNSTAEEGQTALMTAALSGNNGVVKLLISRGAKVDVAEPYRGQTALMWAASEGNTTAAETLVEFGASQKSKSKGGLTPFLFAVRDGRLETAQALLKLGANVNDVAPDGTSALNMAVVNAYFELAGMLLEHGANPNAPDPRGSALHTIAWLRKPGTDGAAGVGATPHGPPQPTGNLSALDLARKLLEKGANPNVRVDWKESRFSKLGGTTRNPPNIQLGRHFLTYVGATPFYLAAKNGDAPLMRVLIQGGANPKIPNQTGITPLMVAAGLDYWEGEAPGPFSGVSEPERLEAVKLALSLGNDVNAQANFGDFKMEGDTVYTLLYYPLNMDSLLDLGVGDPRWSGSSALIGAIISGQPSIVQYLIDNGAKVDMKMKLGWTPLMVAEGVFFANAKKEFPPAAAILRKALADQAVPRPTR